MSRLGAVAFLPLGAVLAAASPPAPPEAGALTGATISVTVTDLRNAKGIVRACMTTDEGKFPKVRMGPPRFSEAAFDIGTEDRALTIRMRYML